MAISEIHVANPISQSDAVFLTVVDCAGATAIALSSPINTLHS
jgi:hypothetical protein